jgi:hypothetical protein
MDAVGGIYAKRRDATVGGEGGKEQFDKGALGELGAVGCVSDRVGDDAVYTCRNTRGCGDRPRRACFFLFFFPLTCVSFLLMQVYIGSSRGNIFSDFATFLIFIKLR